MDVSVKTERSGVLARTQSPAATTARRQSGIVDIAQCRRSTSKSIVVAAGDYVRLRSLRFAPTHIHRPYSARRPQPLRGKQRDDTQKAKKSRYTVLRREYIGIPDLYDLLSFTILLKSAMAYHIK
jgi:hypothetical protein